MPQTKVQTSETSEGTTVAMTQVPGKSFTTYEVITMTGAICVAIMGIIGLSSLIFRNMFKAHMRDADVRKAQEDAETKAEFKRTETLIETVAKALKEETDNRVHWEKDFEARKQHTKADHEQKLAALDRRISKQAGDVEENTRRIIRLEESLSGIKDGQRRIEQHFSDRFDKMEGAMSKQLENIAANEAQHFDQLCASIREISKRSPKD